MNRQEMALFPRGCRGMESELVRVIRERTMMTNATPSTAARTLAPTSVGAQKVVIVNGSADVMDLVGSVLDAGHYDVIFVESSEHAYSQVKRVQPNLVILCVRIEDVNAFQVLSMLKLDEETREIPVLTYTTEYEGQEVEEEEPESSGVDLFPAKQALSMN
jgi:PleD family two-component response regulator